MPDDLLSVVLPVILVGGIGLVVGGVAGFLLAGLQTPPPEAPKTPRGLVEVVRVWRNKRSGALAFELDGQVLEHAAKLTSAQRSLLIQAGEQLRLWLGLPDAAERSPASASTSAPAAPLSVPLSAPPAQPALTRPPGPTYASAVRSAVSASEDDLLPLPIRSLLEEPAVRPASVDISGAISQALRPDKGSKDAQVETRSIAQQVDTIVQERLPGSPLAAHTIRVTDAPPGKIGLIVQVDDYKYEGVGDVGDAQIQAFLRACVAEWERRGGK